MFISGNEAVALGAIDAGCRFFGGYPITPSSEIAEQLSILLPKVNGRFIQMEDEIASIAAVIGASLAGLKAMTATSGPGYSLMQENIGFAVMAEVPCVIVNVMRAGPSTGLPTMPAQGDIMQARWGTHGDHPAIALTASSVEEAYKQVIRAFNLSEKYRIPVTLLLDEIIGHMKEKFVLPEKLSIEIVNRIQPSVPPEWYFPFDETDSCVPPMANFGEGYRYHVTGLTHDRAGYPTSRSDEIVPLINRMFKKIEMNYDDIIKIEEININNCDVLIIAFGSAFRSAKAVAKLAANRKVKAGIINLLTLWPFPVSYIRELIKNNRKLKAIIVPELNKGQLKYEVERTVLGKVRVEKVNRYDGRIITPDEILEVIKGVC